jgi:hypothetical protein
LGDHTRSNATACLALRVTGTHKPLYHGKVEISIKELQYKQKQNEDIKPNDVSCRVVGMITYIQFQI